MPSIIPSTSFSDRCDVVDGAFGTPADADAAPKLCCDKSAWEWLCDDEKLDSLGGIFGRPVSALGDRGDWGGRGC